MLGKTRSDNEIPDGLVDFSATAIKINSKHYILVHGGRDAKHQKGHTGMHARGERVTCQLSRGVAQMSHASLGTPVAWALWLR